jgi:nitrate reductase delta subunit
MSLLKLIGTLLDYPQDELWLRRGALLDEIDKQPLPGGRRDDLKDFVGTLLDSDPARAQDFWRASFERDCPMSLLLFEHIYGESHGRVQAMVDLEDTFRRHGFDLSINQVPDQLPVVLRYLSQRPAEEARDWLRQIHSVVAVLAAEAADRGNPYAVLFEVLAELAENDPGIDVGSYPAGEIEQAARAEVAALH